MKILRLNKQMLDVVHNNNGLKVYLNNLSIGRSATPRAWLYKDKEPSEVLQSWMKILSSLKYSGSPFERLVFQYDISKLAKWGPQGAVKPIKELMDIVTAGFRQAGTPKPELYSTKEWLKAKELAIKYLIKDTGLFHKLTPRSYRHVVDDMAARDTLDSNSGYPDFGRRNKPEIISSAIQDIESGKYLDYPAIVLFRNYKAKTRLVWMYPISVNIKEGSYVQPLKEALMQSDLNFIAPWRGYEHVLNRITKWYNSGEYVSASDFSHTDEFFSRFDTLEVFDVIKHAFQPKYWDDLKQSMLHVNEIPLLFSPTQMITGWHGVSSGSNWTNDLETYYDFIFAEYFTQIGLVSEPGYAIGDDMAHRNVKYNPNFSVLSAKEFKRANKDVQASKVTNERDYVISLQRINIRGYYSNRHFIDSKGVSHRLLRGIYSTTWALNSSLYPEKFHSPKLWSKDMFALRQFMILENTIDHPLFETFVKFICSGNHYLVEFAKKKKEDLDKILVSSRRLPGLNPTYNQEKRDMSLADFASIKVAATLD